MAGCASAYNYQIEIKPGRKNMQIHGVVTPYGGNGRSQQVLGSPSQPDVTESDLIQTPRAIVISAAQGEHIDKRFVSLKYYNAFNYSMITTDPESDGAIIGVTSPNAGEGKTLIASNLATSLALSSHKSTILVDLNMRSPRVHDVFGVSISPGFTEALHDDEVHVSRTKIDRLSVLTAGRSSQRSIDLRDLVAFKDVLFSLRQQFHYVIVDMSSLDARDFPFTLANAFSGVLMVVDISKTRRRHIDKAFRQIPYDHVLGFIFNKVTDDNF
jgi:Mrp family chromosome partitioning ATPase